MFLHDSRGTHYLPFTRTKEMTSAIKRGIRNAEKNEDSKSWDAYMDRNRRLLDKGIDAVKRERSKTYFS